MLTHEESSELLDSTMAVLERESGTETTHTGTTVIDQWLAQLQQAENATGIVNTLEQVKKQLESPQLATDTLSTLLTTLATQTAEFSTLMGSEGDMATRLEALSSALQSLAGQMGHEG